MLMNAGSIETQVEITKWFFKSLEKQKNLFDGCHAHLNIFNIFLQHTRMLYYVSAAVSTLTNNLM